MQKTINDFRNILEKVAIGRTAQEVFSELRDQGCSRVVLMIVDSALKGMPIPPLKNTLLLREDKFQETLQNATKLLQSIFDSQ